MQIRLILIGMLSVLFSHSLYAEYDATTLNKLFTDKGQRAQIDAIRSGNNSGPDALQTNKLKINGYMTRSDGQAVVWVNNKSTLDSTTIGDVRIHKNKIGNNKKIAVSVDGKTKYLRPGETWYKESGKVVDHQ